MLLAKLYLETPESIDMTKHQAWQITRAARELGIGEDEIDDMLGSCDTAEDADELLCDLRQRLVDWLRWRGY